VALALAIRKLLAEGRLSRSPLITPVAAVSVGIVGGLPLVDLDYVEDAGAEVDLNLVMTGTGAFVEVQGTGEQGTFTQAQLDELLDLGRAGIEQLLAAQQAVLSPP
jgi:ribonuclease PH